MKIIVDAMGGDYAPENAVEGAIQALHELDVDIVLVGQEARVRDELAKHSYPEDRVDVVHADDVVEMTDPATITLRQKKNSSIAVGVELLKDPQYSAFISAGNTGAVVAASTVKLRMIEGVDRPAIGLVIPTVSGASFLIDVGANTDAKPEHLLQSALMARVYMKEVIGVDAPSVGLLNIGEEEGKGTGFAKDSYKLLEESVEGFAGNVEANEIYKGKTNCIICDGFVGNVVLKVSEGLLESVGKLMKQEVKKNPFAILGALLMKSSLGHIKKKSDYSEYGGAPLLGVNGVVMISHGRSSAKAIKNAIRAAKQEVEHDILTCLQREVSKVGHHS